MQPDPKFFAPRAVIYVGPSLMSGYTIQADLYATAKGRRKPELGLINSGYTALIAGIQQRIEIRSWGSELRMMQRQDFAWEVDTWYTMKLRVDIENDDAGRQRAAVRAKVWKRADDEPADWTFTVHDPLPIKQRRARGCTVSRRSTATSTTSRSPRARLRVSKDPMMTESRHPFA